MESSTGIASPSRYPSSQSDYPIRISSNIFGSGSNSFVGLNAPCGAHSCCGTCPQSGCKNHAPWQAAQGQGPPGSSWSSTDHGHQSIRSSGPEPCAVCGLPSQGQSQVNSNTDSRFPVQEQFSNSSLASITVGYNGRTNSSLGLRRSSELAMPYQAILPASARTSTTSQLATSLMSAEFTGAECQVQPELPDIQPACESALIHQDDGGTTWPPTFSMPGASSNDDDEAPTDLEEQCQVIHNTSRCSIEQDGVHVQETASAPTPAVLMKAGDVEKPNAPPPAALPLKVPEDTKDGPAIKPSLSYTECTNVLQSGSEAQAENETDRSRNDISDSPAGNSSAKSSPPLSPEAGQGVVTGHARQRTSPFKIHNCKHIVSPRRFKKRGASARLKFNVRNGAVTSGNGGAGSCRDVPCDNSEEAQMRRGDSISTRNSVHEMALGLADFREIVRDITDQLAQQLSHINTSGGIKARSRDNNSSSHAIPLHTEDAKASSVENVAISDTRNSSGAPAIIESSEELQNKTEAWQRKNVDESQKLERHDRPSESKVIGPSSLKGGAQDDLATDLDLMSGAAEALCTLLAKYKNEVPSIVAAASRDKALVEKATRGLRERILSLSREKTDKTVVLQKEENQTEFSAPRDHHHAQKCHASEFNSSTACEGTYKDTSPLSKLNKAPAKEFDGYLSKEPSVRASSPPTAARQPWASSRLHPKLSKSDMMTQTNRQSDSHLFGRTPMPERRFYRGRPLLRRSGQESSYPRRTWMSPETVGTFRSEPEYGLSRPHRSAVAASSWLRSASDGDALCGGRQPLSSRWHAALPNERFKPQVASAQHSRRIDSSTNQNYEIHRGAGAWSPYTRQHRARYSSSSKKLQRDFSTSNRHFDDPEGANSDSPYDTEFKPLRAYGDTRAYKQPRGDPTQQGNGVLRFRQSSAGTGRKRISAFSRINTSTVKKSESQSDRNPNGGESIEVLPTSPAQTSEARRTRIANERSDMRQPPAQGTRYQRDWSQMKLVKAEEPQSCNTQSARREQRSPCPVRPMPSGAPRTQNGAPMPQESRGAARSDNQRTDVETEQPNNPQAKHAVKPSAPQVIAEGETKSQGKDASVNSESEQIITSLRLKPSISSLSDASCNSLSSTGMPLNVESFFSRSSSDDQAEGRGKLIPVLSPDSQKPGIASIRSEKNGLATSPRPTPSTSAREGRISIVNAAVPVVAANPVGGAAHNAADMRSVAGSPTRYASLSTEHVLQGPTQQQAMSPILKPSRACHNWSEGVPANCEGAFHSGTEREPLPQRGALLDSAIATPPSSVSLAALTPTSGTAFIGGRGEPAGVSDDATKSSCGPTESDGSSDFFLAPHKTSVLPWTRGRSCPPLVHRGSREYAIHQCGTADPDSSVSSKPVGFRTHGDVPFDSVEDTESSGSHDCGAGYSLSSNTSDNSCEGAVQLPVQQMHNQPSNGAEGSGNASLILHALQNVLFSGPDQTRKLQKVLRAYKRNWQPLNRFVIALTDSDGGLSFRAIYALSGGEFILICKYRSAPAVLEPAIIERYFLYNASALTFVPLQNTAALTGAFDAVTLAA